MIGVFTARLIVAASAIVITATLVGLFKLAEHIFIAARKLKLDQKPALSHAE